MAFRSMQTLLKSLPKLNCIGQSSNLARGVASHPVLRINGTWNFPRVADQQCKTLDGMNGLLKLQPPQQQFHLLSQIPNPIFKFPRCQLALDVSVVPNRTVTKFSLRKGRRKTVKCVLKRFYRLDWGIWIRPKSGRHKRLWKKNWQRRKRLRMHVFCNAWHTKTLDRMTTKYWHKKKYWVDDPYENYHTRNDFWITKNTRNIIHQLD